MVHATLEWSALHDRFYRKHLLYTMLWSEEVESLDSYRWCIAPCGGPIALLPKDEQKRNQAGASTGFLRRRVATPHSIRIFSSAGLLLQEFPWESTIPALVEFAWTEEEELVCVTQDGAARVFTLDGDCHQFSLGQETMQFGVQECRISATGGLVYLTGQGRFVAVKDFQEPRPVFLADPASVEGMPTCWTIIPSHVSASRTTEVLAAYGTSIVSIDGREARGRNVQDGPFQRIALSPNGKLIALFSSKGTLVVYSSDFEQKLLEFPSKSKILPSQMVWCGNDSVLLAWDQILLMIGPFGDWVKYSYDGAFALFTEPDGARIFSDTQCEFLERVPDVCEEVFKIGSTSPSAMLLDAFDHYEKRNPKADEIVRSFREELHVAVHDCIQAAGMEFSVTFQKQLLRAASFGKSFFEETSSSDSFTKMCKMLRVLNAIRDHEIGLPLSYQQLAHLGISRLIQRLLRRNRHLLSLRISEYMNLKSEPVLVDWACALIKHSTATDEDLCKKIVSKLESKNFSFAQVAKLAYERGRPLLSARLLDYEKRPSEQVPLLLSMQEHDLALTKAIQSGDADLVFTVLFHMKRQLSLAEFFRSVDKHPSACHLLQVYAKERNVELLRDFYYQDDRRYESAMLFYQEAQQCETVADKQAKLKLAGDMIRGMKDYVFVEKVFEDAGLLAKLQDQFDRELGVGYSGTSLNETLFRLIQTKQAAKVQKLRKDFRVPDKRFWWIQVRALADSRQWEELEKISRLRKSPIGYEPFVDACFRHGNILEAKRYILKCDANKRARLYLKIGATREAIDQAYNSKDTEVLREIRKQAGMAPYMEEITKMLLQLGLND